MTYYSLGKKKKKRHVSVASLRKKNLGKKKKGWNCQSLDISGLNYFQEED